MKRDRAVGGGFGLAVSTGPQQTGRWQLADGSTLELRFGGELVRRTGNAVHPVAQYVLGLPAVANSKRRVVFSRRVAARGELVAMELREGRWTPLRRLWSDGQPDRPALSPDGRRVVFVAGNRGVAGLWVIGFDGTGAAALTNSDLSQQGASPGRPPAGFIAVPHLGAPEVLTDRVRWQAPDGWHEAVLP